MRDDSSGSSCRNGDGQRRRRRPQRRIYAVGRSVDLHWPWPSEDHRSRSSQKGDFTLDGASKTLLSSMETDLSNPRTQRSSSFGLTKRSPMRVYVILVLVVVYGLSSTLSLWVFRIEQNAENTNGNKLRFKSASDGWKRISPSSWTPNAGEKSLNEIIDYDLVGKSCRWIPYGIVQKLVRRYIISPVAILFFQRRPPIGGRWECRDCGGAGSNNTQEIQYSSWESCSLMEPRRKCPAFEFQQWDTPKPQSSSSSSLSTPSSSSSTTTATTVVTTRLLTTFGVGKVVNIEYEQPQCQADHHTYHHQQSGWSHTCFDLQRCYDLRQYDTDNYSVQRRQGGNDNSTSSSFRLKVYAYPGKARSDVQNAVNAVTSKRHSKLTSSRRESVVIELVEDPVQACLLIIHVEDLIEWKTPKTKPSTTTVSLHNNYEQRLKGMISTWNHGQNHYVYGVTQPIMVEKGVHFDYASVGSVAWTDAHIRQGFDVALPLPAKWYPPPPTTTTTTRTTTRTTPSNANWIDDDHLHRPRKYLLTFQGSIQDTLQPYYQHRWLAAEYIVDDNKHASGSSNGSDVVIDVQCKHKSMWDGGNRITIAPYDIVDPTNRHFDELMIESTFGFCPGGSQVSSFRFTEVLSVGSIPVVTPEIVLPFTPELDWTGCVVRITQSRIVDLPRILRQFTRENVRQRQKECRRLFRYIENDETTKQLDGSDNGRKTTRGEKDPTINAVVTALKVWSTRIYLQLQQEKVMKSEFSES